MSDYITSLIRTWTPMLVGALVSWLSTRGVDISQEASLALGAFLTALFGATYYAVIRSLEKRFPKIGLLLGSAKKVIYKEQPDVK